MALLPLALGRQGCFWEGKRTSKSVISVYRLTHIHTQVRVVQHKQTKALYALKYINKQVSRRCMLIPEWPLHHGPRPLKSHSLWLLNQSITALYTIYHHAPTDTLFLSYSINHLSTLLPLDRPSPRSIALYSAWHALIHSFASTLFSTVAANHLHLVACHLTPGVS